MLPKLCTFIAEGVRVNVVQFNLALLIYLMRMVKALLENQTLYLEKYLHELIPSVATCIVSKQLCLRPEADNHWALRDFASKLIAQICKNYTTSTNNIQTRISQVFSTALSQEKTPLSSVYGAIAGLGEMGTEVIKALVIPKIKGIATRLEFIIEGVGHTQADKTSAIKIKQILAKVVCGILKTLRPTTDTAEDYRNDFGYLGDFLRSSVNQLRVAEIKQQQQQAPTTPTGAGGSSPVIAVRSVASPTATGPVRAMVQPSARPVPVPTVQGQKYVLINQPTGAQAVRVLTQPQQIKQGVGGGKVVILSQPSQQQHDSSPS
jgi:transcription initiation factor TFIID subunit 6